MAVKKVKTNQDVLDEFAKSQAGSILFGAGGPGEASGGKPRYKDIGFAGAPSPYPTSEGSPAAGGPGSGDAYIQAREKIATTLIDQGLSPKAAQAEAARRVSLSIEQGTSSLGASGTGESTPAEILANQSQLSEQFRREGVFNPFPEQQNPLLAGSATSAEGFQQINEAADKELRLANWVDNKLGGRVSPEIKEAGGIRLLQARLQVQVAVKFAEIADRALIAGRAGLELGTDIPFVGDIIGGIVGNRREKVNNLKSSLDKRKEMASQLSSDVKEGNVDPQTAFRTLNSLEQQLNEAESLIQQEAILSPSVRRSGILEDIQVTMLQQRQAIARARVDVASVAMGEPDMAKISNRLQELERLS